MRVEITDIHKNSKWYQMRNRIIGNVYTARGIMDASMLNTNGWSCAIIEETPFNGKPIYGFKYIEVPEPSAMSDVSRWLEEHGKTHPYDIGVPKKLSWFQKIRGYDDLQARCNSVESMRDHYKTAMTEALRDRDLNAKVADKWQEKLVEKNKVIDNLKEESQYFQNELEEIVWNNATIGRRLTFSVGHNHVTIIVGNPICVAENYNFIKPLKNGSFCATAYSNPCKKDIYNWKTGVIQALENLCNFYDYSKNLRRDLRKALAKKYPEVFRD